MKIAVAQISCLLGDITGNLAKVREFATRASEAGAEIIVFPEMVDTGYSMPVIQAHAMPWSEGAIPELKKIAQESSIAIVAGVSERDGGSIYNSQAVVDANGDVAVKYRKTHLFADLPLEEHKCFWPGNELVNLDAGEFRFGLSICYDLRFPEVYRTLAVGDGVQAFIVSSAWPFPRVEHFRTLAMARAIENQSYMILANRVGTDDGITFCGNSAIIDPYGVVVASAAADREELIQAEISQEVIDFVRNRMAIFAHRRPDLYKL